MRCGQCDAVFRADLHMLRPFAAGDRGAAVAGETGSADSGSFEAERGERPQAINISDDRELRESRLAAASGADLPTVTELRWGKPRPRTRWPFWLMGNAMLLALLAAQFAYFYRNELAQEPALRPYLVDYCQWVGCELRTPYDVSRIDLAQATVAPHPRYRRALRIRATIVNRASFSQPYPSIEVSLTNSDGNVVTRRSFTPQQYLGASQGAEAILIPNVGANVLLDIANPGDSAVGYEIRLVDPPLATTRAS